MGIQPYTTDLPVYMKYGKRQSPCSLCSEYPPDHRHVIKAAIQLPLST